MKKTTFTIIFVASVCVTILASIALVAPKAVRAAVATLIRDQDNAARHPWTASCGIGSPSQACQVSLGAGNEYVIQSVSFSLANGSGFNAAIVSAGCGSGGSQTQILQAVAPVLITGSSLVSVYQTFPLTAYCDSGIATFGIGLNGAAPTFFSADVWLNGYYVTLP